MDVLSTKLIFVTRQGWCQLYETGHGYFLNVRGSIEKLDESALKNHLEYHERYNPINRKN